MESLLIYWCSDIVKTRTNCSYICSDILFNSDPLSIYPFYANISNIESEEPSFNCCPAKTILNEINKESLNVL
jgi:hypothetical protein